MEMTVFFGGEVHRLFSCGRRENWGVCVCVCVERVMRLARFFLGNSFWVDDDVLLD